MHQFYHKYYNDNKPRIFLWGINPGRFGAGITGIPFTDPKALEEQCDIPNPFDKKFELSSVFIYDIIERLGGPAKFYSKFYITSLCPLGFLSEGKNYNYYDSNQLFDSVEAFMVKCINEQLSFQSHKQKWGISLGKGKNAKAFSLMNKKHGWFDEIEALPHPRWVMQYQRKNYELHLDSICQKLFDAMKGLN